jgi:hypothetical protein
MTQAEDYRAKAAAADEIAAQVFFSEVEAQFRQIADGWRALALQADQLSRRDAAQVAREDRFIPKRSQASEG